MQVELDKDVSIVLTDLMVEQDKCSDEIINAAIMVLRLVMSINPKFADDVWKDEKL